ncbi:Hypothetical predicted protein [Paramuricea clavata]|uniref:Uncharacterized protein n=1 Tax=Paramuricea clavata TaxID=317549 RepID=A0A6S7HUK4_PARCT|nr:Hypothetical predicted protein [Paramuricea clavata]
MRTTLENIRGPRNRDPFVNVPGGTQPNRIFVTEPGLYSLVSRSRLPAAEDFQRWVFEDVLPSIRRTGTYTLPGVMNMIKGIDDMELQQLGMDDQAEARGDLVHKGNLVKNKLKVEAGKKGGKAVQENIRQLKIELEEKGFKVYEQEKEVTELRIKVSCLGIEIDVLEEEKDELLEENERFMEEINRLVDTNDRLAKELEKMKSEDKTQLV